uniref:Uncharacterized protein n=1 Tax=Arundo donax TaxID=35708 RepID=A0A0A9FFT5_ARUDO
MKEAAAGSKAVVAQHGYQHWLKGEAGGGSIDGRAGWWILGRRCRSRRNPGKKLSPAPRPRLRFPSTGNSVG